MKWKIWKYKISHYGLEELEMPKGAQILKGKMVKGEMFIWAIVDASKEMETRAFSIYGTGYLMPSGLIYVDTVFDRDFVWHIMEVDKLFTGEMYDDC